MKIGASPNSLDFLRGGAFFGQEFFERTKICGPLEHYRLCRSLLFRVSEEGATPQLKTSFLRARRYPYAESYQPSCAALALLSQIFGVNRAPVTPDFATDAPMPLAIAWQLSVLWRELGDKDLIEQAEKVQKRLFAFGERAKTLFYSEQAFQQKEADLICLASERNAAANAELGMAAFADSCLTLTGSNSSLGSLRLGGVSIPAFGPQADPLSDPRGFGVSQLKAHGSVSITSKEGAELDGWTRCYGNRESWLHLKGEMKKNFVRLDIKFAGRTPYMAFYVRADKCFVESEGKTFSPKNLNRYQGKASSVLFNDAVRLEAHEDYADLQIIPLAGNDCFWNANFLLAFSCPSHSFVSFLLQR